MIVFSSVRKSFGPRKVLEDVNFRIEPGEFVFFTGPSGAGKSTIINLLICAELPTSGKIEIDGVDLSHVPPSVLQLYRRRTGVLFQDYKLLNDRTVQENVAFAMEVCGDEDSVIERRVPLLLRKLGLAGQSDVFPYELSGGEKARTALARALIHHPMILICDEPTGNIDPQQSLQILDFLRQVNREGVTVLIASHDQVLVDAMQTRVLRLQDGKIVRDSIGGYDTGRAHVDAGDETKHRIFEKVSAKYTHPVDALVGDPQAALREAEEKIQVAQAEAEERKLEANDADGGDDESPKAGGSKIKPVAI